MTEHPVTTLWGTSASTPSPLRPASGPILRAIQRLYSESKVRSRERDTHLVRNFERRFAWLPPLCSSGSAALSDAAYGMGTVTLAVFPVFSVGTSVAAL